LTKEVCSDKLTGRVQEFRLSAGFCFVRRKRMSKTTPKDLAKKRNDEKLLISEMIALYCRKQHHSPKGKLCPECQQLHDYALARIEHCPFMETKTFCSACKVHCYKPEMREQIRTVMRWAGPRMLPVHPVLSIKHVIVTMKARREANAGK
jgi:hypothetical protein